MHRILALASAWLLLAAPLVLGPGEAASAHAHPGAVGEAAGAEASAMTVAGAPNSRAFWYAIGDSPTPEEVDRAASTMGVVVLNPWDGWALRQIKRRNPAVVVLMYKCMSSTRRYADGYAQPLPTGVGFGEAERTNPAWFAVDTTGSRIEWQGYPDHWQMAVWDAGYQQRWTANVVDEVVAGGWDGVLADNDFASLRYYSPAVLAGTRDGAATDSRIRAGLDQMVDVAGTALTARGKRFVPNLSEARSYPGRWAAHSRYGGAMEENFVHWGTDGQQGFISDWPGSGWASQTSEMSGEGLSLAITRAAPDDHRSLLYGYASLLVRGDTSSYWSPSADVSGTYSALQTIPEQSWVLGASLTSPVEDSSGVWQRRFEKAIAVVNPTTRWVTTSVPAGFVDQQGRQVSRVTLEPTSAALFRRP